MEFGPIHVPAPESLDLVPETFTGPQTQEEVAEARAEAWRAYNAGECEVVTDEQLAVLMQEPIESQEIFFEPLSQ